MPKKTCPPWVLRATIALGERVLIARKARYMTQEQLALLSDVGISTIYAIEGGYEGVSVGNLFKVLHSLDALEQVGDLLDPAKDPQITAYALARLKRPPKGDGGAGP